MIGLIRILVLFAALGWGQKSFSYTANKIWFLFLESGRMRIKIVYTVPALKELREVSIEYNDRRRAEADYWKLVRGAEFYPPDSKNGIVFPNKNLGSRADPW